MPALVAGIHVLDATANEDVDGRNKSGHDELRHCPACSLAGDRYSARGIPSRSASPSTLARFW